MVPFPSSARRAARMRARGLCFGCSVSGIIDVSRQSKVALIDCSRRKAQSGPFRPIPAHSGLSPTCLLRLVPMPRHPGLVLGRRCLRTSAVVRPPPSVPRPRPRPPPPRRAADVTVRQWMRPRITIRQGETTGCSAGSPSPGGSASVAWCGGLCARRASLVWTFAFPTHAFAQ